MRSVSSVYSTTSYQVLSTDCIRTGCSVQYTSLVYARSSYNRQQRPSLKWLMRGSMIALLYPRKATVLLTTYYLVRTVYVELYCKFVLCSMLPVRILHVLYCAIQ